MVPPLKPAELHLQLPPAKRCPPIRAIALLDAPRLDRRTMPADPCAARDLARHLAWSLGRPEVYAQAAALAAAAQDAGALLDGEVCTLFDLSGDRQRLAACYEANRPERTPWLLALGAGVPQDFAQAQQLTVDPLVLDAIRAVQAGKPPASPRYCGNSFATNGRDSLSCAEDALIERDVATSTSRAHALDRLGNAADLARLHDAFVAYRRAEIGAFLAGSLGTSIGVFMMGRAKDLHELYDDLLELLAGLRPSPDASPEEVAESTRRLQRAEREATGADSLSALRTLHGPDAPAQYMSKLAESSRRYRALETLVSRVAKDRLGEGRARGIRVALQRARTAALGTEE